jgi:tripartite-type tricarboxylate transporter receptor subunit TctC
MRSPSGWGWLQLVGVSLSQARFLSNGWGPPQIIPFPPGGASDFIARLWGDKLLATWGQPFVLDNKGGASGTIGVEAAIRSAPDGHTLLQTPNSPLTVVPQLRKVSYDAKRDLIPIARMGDMVSGFVITPTLGLTHQSVI